MQDLSKFESVFNTNININKNVNTTEYKYKIQIIGLWEGAGRNAELG